MSYDSLVSTISENYCLLYQTFACDNLTTKAKITQSIGFVGMLDIKLQVTSVISNSSCYNLHRQHRHNRSFKWVDTDHTYYLYKNPKKLVT